MPTYEVIVAVPDEDNRVIMVNAVDAETAGDYVCQNEVADVKDAMIVSVEEVK